MKTQTALHLATLAVALDRHLGGNPSNNPAQTIHSAHRLAKALRARYEAQCSYEWANTPAYEKRTEKLEAKLCAMLEAAGFVRVDYWKEVMPRDRLAYALQRDPRVWPLILSIGGRVDRVGGEV